VKIKQVKIKNFRSYQEEVIIDIGDLTAFVGRNDVGKSTVLEALDIFLNDNTGTVKIDANDASKHSTATDIVISAIFSDLPESIIIDDSNKTSFLGEYLLNSEGNLEIIKRYSNGGKTIKISIKAIHPGNPECSDLLLKKQDVLKKIVEKHKIDCKKTVNAIMRKAIWEHFSSDLQLQEQEIDASKEDAKNIWEKIKEYLPIYFLFQSDRKNTDGDSEVQDPLKFAMKQIFRKDGVREKLDAVADEIRQGLSELSDLTLKKLKFINPELANTLSPNLPDKASLGWDSVFKGVSIFGDNDIPINKRGSGVKRLVLLSFFQAEAERKLKEEEGKTGHKNSVIYAIEEPETSQHFEHQKTLMASLKDLAKSTDVQVLLTTHNPVIVKQLDFDSLRLISVKNNKKDVSPIEKGSLLYPSLNEINHIAFGELTEEYHNELYGYIESEGKINDFLNIQSDNMPYIKELKDKSKKQESRKLSQYIRDQIHHPENKNNPRFTPEQIKKSISEMREFIAKGIVTSANSSLKGLTAVEFAKLQQ